MLKELQGLVNYHHDFSAFGMYFKDNLGHHGQTDHADSNNKLKAGSLRVLHLHSDDGQPFYTIGEEAAVPFSDETWVVDDVADLGIQEHQFGYDFTYPHGYVYLVRSIAT